MSIQQARRPLALVLGVANARSIAWSCVRSFLNNNYDVILTYQNEKIGAKVERMMHKHIEQQQQQHDTQQQQQQQHPSLTGLICDVQHDIPKLFQHVSQHHRPLHAIVHSVAFANNLHRPLLNTTFEDYQEAHAISAYSLIELARHAQPHMEHHSTITALTYLGAVRAIPSYHVMGPAKASLESIVRGLALEMAPVRVNAVSAGPLNTVAAKGGIANFGAMRQEMQERAPLGNVTADEVADTVSFLSMGGTGITGQTIYVDGGYSIVGGLAVDGPAVDSDL